MSSGSQRRMRRISLIMQSPSPHFLRSIAEKELITNMSPSSCSVRPKNISLSFCGVISTETGIRINEDELSLLLSVNNLRQKSCGSQRCTATRDTCILSLRKRDDASMEASRFLRLLHGASDSEKRRIH